MRLAGLNITDNATLELVKRLRRGGFDYQADTIEGALVPAQADVALTFPDRVAILAVLEDRPNLSPSFEASSSPSTLPMSAKVSFEGLPSGG